MTDERWRSLEKSNVIKVCNDCLSPRRTITGNVDKIIRKKDGSCIIWALIPRNALFAEKKGSRCRQCTPHTETMMSSNAAKANGKNNYNCSIEEEKGLRFISFIVNEKDLPRCQVKRKRRISSSRISCSWATFFTILKKFIYWKLRFPWL